MSTPSRPDLSSSSAHTYDGVPLSSRKHPQRDGSNRGLLIAASITLAVGFTALAVGVWGNYITADDGTGANIGAGILMLFGGAAGAAGIAMLVVVAASAIVTRARR